MNTKRRLNCYVFGNLIVSFLTLNLMVNPTSRVLIQKDSNTKLNKIYEKEIITISTPDTIIGSGEQSNVIRISNSVSSKENNNYSYNYVKPTYNSITGNNLVNYAKNFLGLRYVSAGNSLSTGTDCSGFTRLIYQEFGISLGRTVSSQLYSGTYVSRDDLQPGDLVFYSYGTVASHVAIYIGDGLIIHESNPRDGVKIASVNIMRYITARRLITSATSVISKEEPVVETKKVENNEDKKVETTTEVVVEEKKEEKVNIADNTNNEKPVNDEKNIINNENNITTNESNISNNENTIENDIQENKVDNKDNIEEEKLEENE